jgi:hypothetical protein
MSHLAFEKLKSTTVDYIGNAVSFPVYRPDIKGEALEYKKPGLFVYYRPG